MMLLQPFATMRKAREYHYGFWELILCTLLVTNSGGGILHNRNIVANRKRMVSQPH